MTKHRLELFSDGVFAIVLTLLVFNLKVPLAHGPAELREIAPALLIHAGTFFAVGVLWMIHHTAFARVVEIKAPTLMFNLFALFWVTLLPYAAETAAARPLDPLGASLMALSCGGALGGLMLTRSTSHSTIDDNARMEGWRRQRLAMGAGFVITDLAGAALAWSGAWIGYLVAVATILFFFFLPAPPDVERRFSQIDEGREVGDGRTTRP